MEEKLEEQFTLLQLYPQIIERASCILFCFLFLNSLGIGFKTPLRCQITLVILSSSDVQLSCSHV